MSNNKLVTSILSKMGIVAQHIINTSKEKVFDIYLKLKDIESAKDFIDFIPQKYQRKYIAKYNKKFLDGIAKTLFCDDLNFDITQLHMRLYPNARPTVDLDNGNRNVFAEILDGLQRLYTLVIFYLSTEENYKLPKIVTNDTDGSEIELTGLTFRELKTKYPQFYKEKYEDRLVSIKCYVNITDAEACTLFRDILNYQNKMNAQMLRNANDSEVATAIRNSVRMIENQLKEVITPNSTVINAFDVFDYTLTKDNVIIPTYVNNEFTNDELAQEEVVASCATYFVKRTSIQPKEIDKLYEDTKYKRTVPWFDSFDKTFRQFSEIVKSLPQSKELLTPKVFIRFFMFYYHLTLNNIKVITHTTFAKMFYDAWIELKKLTKEEKRLGHKNNAFERSTNNKDSKHLQITLDYLFQYFSQYDLKDWGCAKLDTKRTFTKQQIDAALHKQNYICPKCDIEISESQKTGGHVVTYCFGGKTEEDNLRVLHKNCNTYDHVKEVA